MPLIMSSPTASPVRPADDGFPDTVPALELDHSLALRPLTTEPPPRAGAVIHCPQCRAPMRHVVLPGHHAPAAVDIDHCGPCGLVWFDARESVHLSALAWIRLLRDLHRLRQPDRPHQPSHACPLCAQTLKEVRNQTRYGRFPALECRACGGHLHSQAGMLAERGLVRPLLAAERSALRAEKRQLCCLSCGGPADGQSDHCAWCRSPLVMVDMPRLANALRRRSPSEPLLTPNGGKPVGWACRGCGAPMDPTRETRCAHCHHAVVTPSLEELGPLLDALEHDWHAVEAQHARDRRDRVASYNEPRDPSGGKHGIFWRGRYEKTDDEDPGDPPTLIEIALRVAAFLLR